MFNGILTLYLDNASAIKLMKNPEFPKNSKDIEVRHDFVHEKFHEKVINFEHIDSHNQTANIMTKPLAREHFF